MQIQFEKCNVTVASIIIIYNASLLTSLVEKKGCCAKGNHQTDPLPVFMTRVCDTAQTLNHVLSISSAYFLSPAMRLELMPQLTLASSTPSSLFLGAGRWFTWKKYLLQQLKQCWFGCPQSVLFIFSFFLRWKFPRIILKIEEARSKL